MHTSLRLLESTLAVPPAFIFYFYLLVTLEEERIPNCRLSGFVVLIRNQGYDLTFEGTNQL